MPVFVPYLQPRFISANRRELPSLHSILKLDSDIMEQKPGQKRNESQQESTSPFKSPNVYVTGHNNVHQDPFNPPIAMEMERSSRCTSIQTLAIKSQQGDDIQIPVDVQSASKLADEKRKRNAGASARFRARQKEKQREASQSISILEEAAKKAEHYRTERDYFATIVFQQPGAERHYVQPTSPRPWRTSMLPSIAPSTIEAQSSLYNSSDKMLTPETSPQKGAKRTAPIVYDDSSRKKAKRWIEDRDHDVKGWTIQEDNKVIKCQNNRECHFRYHNYLRKRTRWDFETTEELMKVFNQESKEFFVKIVHNMDGRIIPWEDAQRRVFKIIAEEGYVSGDSDGEPDTEEHCILS
ncbi:hypothetical protein K505DRAFT_378758 [Melanomma pulvis-pyrius CBS 109.77]|uniref:BZIP domain-containing protein n=1 Tax=Melanomma pulvis-pyrius CBS 109.77 TaxID=1314802 RepID=A0A6A6WX22_9PLEO|nr:hypothetical protein K505DRAFT_378758 [Melanomma pulvis-pyrius CBS 109.77]